MYIEISLKNVKKYLNEMQSAVRKLNYQKARIVETKVILQRCDDTAMAVVVKKLDKQVNALDESIRNVNKLITGLEKILDAYEQCEERIVDSDITSIWKDIINVKPVILGELFDNVQVEKVAWGLVK